MDLGCSATLLVQSYHSSDDASKRVQISPYLQTNMTEKRFVRVSRMAEVESEEQSELTGHEHMLACLQAATHH